MMTSVTEQLYIILYIIKQKPLNLIIEELVVNNF